MTSDIFAVWRARSGPSTAISANFSNFTLAILQSIPAIPANTTRTFYPLGMKYWPLLPCSPESAVVLLQPPIDLSLVCPLIQINWSVRSVLRSLHPFSAVHFRMFFGPIMGYPSEILLLSVGSRDGIALGLIAL